MINFVSTFPPIVCGVGSYTEYLTRQLKNWRVTSFNPDRFSKSAVIGTDTRVSYNLSFDSHPAPFAPDGRQLVWFQHAFGIWGRDIDHFTDLVGRLKREGAKTAASFHTVHFESGETGSGLTIREQRLMSGVLPFLDAATVFSDGAWRALSKAFPQFATKIVVLRHGAHRYSMVRRNEARRRLLAYLEPRDESATETEMVGQFLSPATIVMGNFGFVSMDKDPLALYEIAERVRKRLPGQRVIALYAGKIANRVDRTSSAAIDLLRHLLSMHDGWQNLFFEEYLPEDLLPYAFRALDLCVFWCGNATQSGRMAHALGSRTCVVGRRIEGIGETLDLAGLPSVFCLDDLVEEIVKLILDPASRERAERLGAEFAERYSFEKQAQKHLLLEDALEGGRELPPLDRSEPDVAFVLPRLGIASRNGLERLDDNDLAYLNVADDVDPQPVPTNYHRIPLRDGTPIPAAKMKEALEWIDRNIVRQRVIVFCRYGKGRSASVAIAYLCARCGMAYKDALELVASHRAGTTPLPALTQTIELMYEN